MRRLIRLIASLIRAVARRRRLRMAVQITAFAVVMGFFAYTVRDSWDEAQGMLRSADRTDLGLALAAVAAYYLSFVVGWRLILRAMGVELVYRDTLRAEMLSMLAKYVPGGVWTPAARVIALRRAGVTDTPLVLGSIAVEAGLSAIAGVLVFLAALTTVEASDTSVWWLVALAVGLAVVLHPRIFRPATTFLARPLGGGTVPVVPQPLMLVLVAYYCLTWLIAGTAVYFLAESVAEVEATSIPYLGGVAAVGAIVAVLAVFAPSGLGVREGAMYTLLLAVLSPAAALGVVALNRLAITMVEGALLLVVGVRGPQAAVEVVPEPEPVTDPSTA